MHLVARRFGREALRIVVLLLGIPLMGAAQIGVFQAQNDIGTVLQPGSAHFDPANGQYVISGNGDNMWFGADDFHFVWTRLTGDISLAADITFVGAKGNDHRKAVLMLRQSLAPNSPYVDVARHGDGLTSLQYRDAPGADTHEVESAMVAPRRVRIVKRGNFAYVYVSDSNGKLQPSGAAMRVGLDGEFYVGLGVCSHDKSVTETAIFSNVKLEKLPPPTGTPILYSTLETVIVASSDRRVRYVAPLHFEAPNWSRDGDSLVFNQDGTMQRWPLDNGVNPALRTSSLATAPTPIPIAPETACNNDHGFSPDGSMLAVSCRASDGTSHIYVLPATGGTPRQVTPNGPSYWHGWSPDGRALAFTGERSGESAIYAVPITGGSEKQLTPAKNLNDGPEYSPDGQWIYFNSDRTGTMQIWRMRPDGSEPQQVLTEPSNDWFPHISPDGRWMVFVAYSPDVKGNLQNQQVELRLMSIDDRKVHVLAKLLGGQGTMDVPSWSPDSKMLAFVSYQRIFPTDLP